MIWVWVWTIPACEGGDLDAIVAKAKVTGVGLMVKTHDGVVTVGPWDPLEQSRILIQKCLDAGVPVRAWGYCYPTADPAMQARVALAPQVDYVADVEAEWDGQAVAAQAYVDALHAERARLAIQVKLAYAPLPIVSLHEGGDVFGHAQYGAFNQLDLACPQAYAGAGGRDAVGALQWTDDQWQHAFPGGVHIEPAVFGADQPPLELLRAIGWVRTKARAFGYDGDVSVWSFQHLTDDEWDVLHAFALPAQEISPAPAAIPAQASAPSYAGQSADARVAAGGVAIFTGIWTYGNGKPSQISRSIKAFAHSPGRYLVDLYPLAEDLVTEHRDAVPARWFLDVAERG